jgi:hypothetical protein
MYIYLYITNIRQAKLGTHTPVIYDRRVEHGTQFGEEALHASINHDLDLLRVDLLIGSAKYEISQIYTKI